MVSKFCEWEAHTSGLYQNSNEKRKKLHIISSIHMWYTISKRSTSSGFHSAWHSWCTVLSDLQPQPTNVQRRLTWSVCSISGSEIYLCGPNCIKSGTAISDIHYIRVNTLLYPTFSCGHDILRKCTVKQIPKAHKFWQRMTLVTFCHLFQRISYPLCVCTDKRKGHREWSSLPATCVLTGSELPGLSSMTSC